MNIIKITDEDYNNGPGIRTVIWCAGCTHNCPLCQNKEAQNPNIGTPVGQWIYDAIDKNLSKSYVKGVTFSGGECTFPANREPSTEIMRYIKEHYPNKTIWIWTGFIYEDIKNLPMMKYVDCVVDGPYVNALNPGINKLRFRGSKNQRVIDNKESQKQGKAILWKDFDGKTSNEF